MKPNTPEIQPAGSGTLRSMTQLGITGHVPIGQYAPFNNGFLPWSRDGRKLACGDARSSYRGGIGTHLSTLMELSNQSGFHGSA